MAKGLWIEGKPDFKGERHFTRELNTTPRSRWEIGWGWKIEPATPESRAIARKLYPKERKDWAAMLRFKRCRRKFDWEKFAAVFLKDAPPPDPLLENYLTDGLSFSP